MATVFVGNLNPRISNRTIEDEFRPLCAVKTFRITRRTPNYAFVNFDDCNDANQVVHNLDGINGWKVKLSHHQHGDGSGGGGGGGGGGGVRPRGGVEEYSKCCFECGEQGHLARDCNLVTSSRIIDRSNRGDELQADRPWRIREYTAYKDGERRRENRAYKDGEQRKIDANHEVPTSQNSFDDFTQKLMKKIDEKVSELGTVYEENESLKRQLNEANSKISSAEDKEEELTLKMKKLKEELEQAENRVTFAKVKGEDMSLMLKKLKEELAKSNYNLTSAKAKEVEMSLKLKKLEEELQKSEKKAVQLNSKVKEVEREKETMQAEMNYIDEKTDEWRKTAEAAAAIFAMGVEISIEISESETPISCYIKRAATQMSLGRIREALWYCRIAATLDSNFPDVHLTSAKCHLVLGETKDALRYYNKCKQSGATHCLDRRVVIEATDGVEKAQKVVSCIKNSSELLQERTFSAATKALEVIGEGLSISSYSEKLLEMKGEALFVLRKYEEAVRLCENTLDFAEKNFATVTVVGGKNLSKTWRWNLMSKSYFHLGRLELALNFIEKRENLKSTGDRTEESTSSLAATVRELLRCKNAGNEAYQSRRYTEAVKHYTNAISRSTESHPFSAVCFSNRAAAYHESGEIVDAIADCSLALALDGSYQKALSRRITLHELIRDHEKAAIDLKRFISLLEKQSSRSNGQEVIQARQRLVSIELKAKRRQTMDLYLILGVNASSSTSEIKTTYRKAALRHHPDKAGQFLARGDCDGQLWKEISETISKDADGLFKIIGNAYAVLSDSGLRSKYDNDEKMRQRADDDGNCTSDDDYDY